MFQTIRRSWLGIMARSSYLHLESSLIDCLNVLKMFSTGIGPLMVKDDLLLEGLKKCKSLDPLPMVHAENGDVVVEGQTRMIDLATTRPQGHPLSRQPVGEVGGYLALVMKGTID